MGRRHDWIEFCLRIGCSLACEYCPQDVLAKRWQKDGGPEKRMSLETFRAVLDHCPLDRIGVDFSGYADPCLHPQFIDFFQEAVARCPVVCLYTTFEGLTKAHYDILKTIPFEELSVHLPDEAEMIHVKWTEDYGKILHALVEDPPKCRRHDRMTVKGPLHHSLAFLEPVRVMAIQPRSSNVNAAVSLHQPAHNQPLKCNRGANLRQNVCLPNGDVYLCCCDYSMTHRLGNLTRQTFDELDGERQKLIAQQQAPMTNNLLCQTCEFAIPFDA